MYLRGKLTDEYLIELGSRKFSTVRKIVQFWEFKKYILSNLLIYGPVLVGFQEIETHS